MKQVGVIGILRSGGHHSQHLLMGRSYKDGMYVLPGGDVQEGETLEEALTREVWECTNLILMRDYCRWLFGVDIIELPNQIIIAGLGSIDFGEDLHDHNDLPMDTDKLFNVGWYSAYDLPWDVSPDIKPLLERYGFTIKQKPE